MVEIRADGIKCECDLEGEAHTLMSEMTEVLGSGCICISKPFLQTAFDGAEVTKAMQETVLYLVYGAVLGMSIVDLNRSLGYDIGNPRDFLNDVTRVASRFMGAVEDGGTFAHNDDIFIEGIERLKKKGLITPKNKKQNPPDHSNELFDLITNMKPGQTSEFNGIKVHMVGPNTFDPSKLDQKDNDSMKDMLGAILGSKSIEEMFKSIFGGGDDGKSGSN